MGSIPLPETNQNKKQAAVATQKSNHLDLSDFKIQVIIPAYNEARLIGSLILKLRQQPVELLVVDDGSTDDTAEIAQAAGAEVLQLESNQGKGAALNAGLGHTSQRQADAIVMIDADGQHLPNELAQIVRPILEGKADITIGSRYLQDTSNTPSHRKFGHKMLNVITNTFSGVQVTDSQSGYRAFSPKAYHLLRFSSKGFSVESEMQFLASEHDLEVLEVPITIQYLDKEKRSAWTQGASVLNGIITLASQYRPLLFFSLPGLLSLVGGVIWGIIVINRYMIYDELAIGYAMICVLLCLLGMTLVSTGITLHSIRLLFLEHLSERRPQPQLINQQSQEQS
jgi:glycosyltransferase involved in cell wall biosynthesis